jgi:hypothetical protein
VLPSAKKQVAAIEHVASDANAIFVVEELQSEEAEKRRSSQAFHDGDSLAKLVNAQSSGSFLGAGADGNRSSVLDDRRKKSFASRASITNRSSITKPWEAKPTGKMMGKQLSRQRAHMSFLEELEEPSGGDKRGSATDFTAIVPERKSHMKQVSKKIMLANILRRKSDMEGAEVRSSMIEHDPEGMRNLTNHWALTEKKIEHPKPEGFGRVRGETEIRSVVGLRENKHGAGTIGRKLLTKTTRNVRKPGSSLSILPD